MLVNEVNRSILVDKIVVRDVCNVAEKVNGQESSSIHVYNLGLTDYIETWHKMRDFTSSRTSDTTDEVWITEHPPIYTLGLNKGGVSYPRRTDIPLVETDRGGKITYHGPGQIIFYLLLDMHRLKITIKQLVHYIESVLILLLKSYGIKATTIKNAPGVYVNNQKIASLGLRVKNGCCYHGVSLNINMDTSPFLAIDPCGCKGVKVTQMRDFGIVANVTDITFKLTELFTSQ